MTQDKVYWELSKESYVDINHVPIVSVRNVDGENQSWEIIAKVNYDDTGMDVKVYQRQGEIIIAFRGTEGSKLFSQDAGRALKDLKADVASVVIKDPVYGGNSNQFAQAREIVRQVKKSYPYADISTTGHSLGGALASYTAAMEDLPAVTWSSPDVLGLLPKDLRKEANEGKFDNTIVNYVHPQDSIGAGSLSKYKRHIGSTYYVGSTFEVANAETINKPFIRFLDSLIDDYHGFDNYTFDEIGNINNPVLTNALTGKEEARSPRFVSSFRRIKVTPDELMSMANLLKKKMVDIENVHNEARMKLLCKEHISRSVHVEIEVGNSLYEFFSWHEQRTGETIYNLELAAKTMKEADKLA